MCEIAGQDSICAYTVNSINNIPAYYYNTNMGILKEKLSKFTSSNLLETDDDEGPDNKIYDLFNTYDSLSDTEQGIIDDNYYDTLSVLYDWYYENIGELPFELGGN